MKNSKHGNQSWIFIGKGWRSNWSSNTLATWCQRPTHWKRPWCWERLKAREGGDRGWDGWMASLTQWTWVSANSGRWWRTGKPGVLQFMGSKRVRYDLVTKQQNYVIKPAVLTVELICFHEVNYGYLCAFCQIKQLNILTYHTVVWWTNSGKI